MFQAHRRFSGMSSSRLWHRSAHPKPDIRDHKVELPLVELIAAKPLSLSAGMTRLADALSARLSRKSHFELPALLRNNIVPRLRA